MTHADDIVQQRDWQILHDKVTNVLDRFGRKDHLGKGDYWLLDDNWGWEVQQLEFQNLALLTPEIVRELQAELIGYPRWSITVRVDVVGKEKEWPGMGIIIHPDEIIDELRRKFLPPEFADRVFASAPGSRFKMFVFNLRTGVETGYDWKDEATYHVVSEFLRELLEEPATQSASDPNRVAFYTLMTRDHADAFDQFLARMRTP